MARAAVRNNFGSTRLPAASARETRRCPARAPAPVPSGAASLSMLPNAWATLAICGPPGCQPCATLYTGYGPNVSAPEPHRLSVAASESAADINCRGLGDISLGQGSIDCDAHGP